MLGLQARDVEHIIIFQVCMVYYFRIYGSTVHMTCTHCTCLMSLHMHVNVCVVTAMECNEEVVAGSIGSRNDW